MFEHCRTVPLLYVRPVSAMNALLDHGSAGAAVLLALVIVCLLWTSSSPVTYAAAQVHAHEPDDESPVPAMLKPAAPVGAALQAGTRFVVPAGFTPLGMLLAVFIPVAIAVVAQWDGLGSSSVIVRRDYMPLLVLVLSAWAAAYLPAAVARWTISSAAFPIPASTAVSLAAHVWFLGMAVAAVRLVMGTSAVRAGVAVMGGWCASILVLTAAGLWSPLLYLTSPCVLYMLYRSTRWETGSLTAGLSGRQSLKRSLEAAAINPRDADAHYQLGLIYTQRRNYTEAESRFRAAIAIDPAAAEAYYELGRIAAAQGRCKEGLDLLRRAAAVDDKLASNEVWREIGAVSLKLGETAAALTALELYTTRRPYDAEGLVYYGNALRRAGSTAEARAAYERAIEAVKTSPSHRRGQLRRWAREAQDALKAPVGRGALTRAG